MFALPAPEELETSLWRDLLDRWFPACVDPKGGFRQRFGPGFEPMDDGARSLVFQSRMIWVCANVAAERPEFAKYAQHGIRFLREKMAGPVGSFVWALDPRGRPMSDEIHAYGLSFALYGLAAAGRLLGDEEALDMARVLWRFLEWKHHDPEHGGYFEATTASSLVPKLEGHGVDAIGTPYGQKSQNTHLHLLEAFTETYRAWPEPLVRKRLEETLALFTQELFAESGHLVLFAHHDWTPASAETSYGHDIEAAHLMLDAADALGPDDPLVMRRARALADNVLAKGWDAKDGGIFYAGTDDGPTARVKNWWAQAEALLGFATLWSRTRDERYAQALSKEWAFIRDHQIDQARGGWYEEVGRPEMPKGHAWKAAYHDGRALLFTARLLKG